VRRYAPSNCSRFMLFLFLVGVLICAVGRAAPAEASWFIERYYGDRLPVIGEGKGDLDIDEPAWDPPARRDAWADYWVKRRSSWQTTPTRPESPVISPRPAPKPAPAPGGAYPRDEVRPDDEALLLRLVNEEREKAGLRPLVLDPALVRVARTKCWDMIANNYFSHTSPTFGTVFDMYRANGIPFVTGGENIAIAGSAYVVHARLMHSSGHRRNILHPDFTHIGIGVLNARPSGVMVAQAFIGR